MNTPDEKRTQLIQLSVAGLVFILGLVLPGAIGIVGPFAALGASATAIVWLPALLFLLALGLPLAADMIRHLELPSADAPAAQRSSLGVVAQLASPVLGLLARLAIVLLIARSLTDPSHSSLPQQLLNTGVTVIAPQAGKIMFLLGAVAVLIAFLPIVAWFLAEMVTSKPNASGPSVAQQTTKWLRAAGLRMTAFLLPVVMRAALKLLAAAGFVVVAAVMWVAYGLRGFHLLTNHAEAARTRSTFGGQLLGMAELLRGAITSGASLGGLFARHLPNVQRDVIRVMRVQGVVTQRNDWRLPSDAPPSLRELNEFASALVIAVDTLLQASAGRPARAASSPGADSEAEFLSGRSGPAPARYPGYEIVASRAWSTPDYHAIILRVSPPAAAEDAAKLTAARLIPLIDSHSSWSAQELTKDLSLSDPRLRSDAHREGQIGLFITLARAVGANEDAPAESPAADRDLVLEAIRRGLVEKRLNPDLFRLAGPPERTFRYLIYRFNTSHWTQTQSAGQIEARLEMIETWKSLRSAIRVIAGYAEDDIGLAHDDRARQFVLALRVPPPPFPGEKPDDDRVLLRPFLQANAATMRATDPRRFCVGLDAEANPVWASFGVTSHALVAGTTGAGKSVSGVLGPMLQLAYINSPSDFGLWVVDTKHETHLYFSNLPHTQHNFTPEGVEDVLPFLEKFNAEAKRRRLAYAGQDWHPGIGDPFLVLVIEEWFQLIESAKSRDVGKVIERVGSTVKAIGAIARSVGCHVVLATQDPRNESLPASLSDLLPLKLVTYGINEPMLRQIFGSQADIEIAKVPKGARGRLAVDGAEGVDGVIQVQALWSHDTAHKPPADINLLIDDIIRRWGPRAKPVADEHPEPSSYSPFIDRTPDDDEDDSPDENSGDLGDRLPRTRPGQAAQVEEDPALPPIPSPADFDSPDLMTVARAVLRLAYRYNSGYNHWQPISRSRVDDLIKAIPGRQGSVSHGRVSQTLRLLTDAGVLEPIPDSVLGERRLHILNWRDAEELLAKSKDEAEELPAELEDEEAA